VIETDPVAAFDGFALEYDRLYEGDTQAGEWLRGRLQAVLDFLGEGPGTILDIGTGSGRLVLALEERGWTAWGIDGSPAMVELARARVPEAAERLLEARAEQLPFEDGTFDAVASMGVISWAHDRPAIVTEIARVLRPGGRAVLTVGNTRSPFRAWRHGVVHPVSRAVKRVVPAGRPAPPRQTRLPRPKELVELLDRAGLSLERMEYACPVLCPDPLDRAFPRTAAALARAAGRLPPSLRSVAAGQRVLELRKPAARPNRPAL
jgi:SAM-dependent methyltransferase